MTLFQAITIITLCSLLSLVDTFRLAFKPPFLRPTSPIQLEFCPLIGGPSFLPVHVQVVVLDEEETKHKFDFIPREAADPKTLAQLLSLQAVPGDLRYLAPGATTKSSSWVQRAQEFTTTYNDPNLQLLTNNCWTFAWKLVQHLEREEGN